jgi:hypothetical protein
VDAGVLYQATNGNDAPYVRAYAGSLRRRAMIAEPYASKLVLGYLTLERAWDSGVKLTSVTSLGSRSSFDVFDSTPRPTAAPVAYQIDRGSTMFAQEIRLARRSDGGLSWVAGMIYQRARDGLTRSLGMPEEPTELDEVTNTTYATSLFGQATLSLGSGISATLGLRWTAARTDSEPSRDTRALIRGVDTRRTDPTAALAWRVAPHSLLYARVQTSYRNGGMAVERGVGRVANFAADSIVMGEAGVRRLRSGTRGLSASMAVSYTHWADIQADLITRRGLPFTANIGNARIVAVEATADWVAARGLTIGGSILHTDSRISGPLPDQTAPRDRRLPETPSWSGAARVSYAWGGRAGEGAGVNRVVGTSHRIGAALRYVGRSILGPGTLINASQGDYAVADLQGGIRRGPVDMSLAVENLFNTRANLFAFGNPVSFAARDQSVPLRPLTVRVTVGVDW